MIEKLLKPLPKTFHYGRVINTAPAERKVQVRLQSGLCLWVDAGGLSLAVGDPLVIAGVQGDRARFIVQAVGSLLPQAGTILAI